jgi:hypothetical protein
MFYIKSEVALTTVFIFALSMHVRAGGSGAEISGHVTLTEDKAKHGACKAGGQRRRIQFSVHAPKDDRPATGFFSEKVECRADGFVSNHFEANVLATCVAQKTATFLIQYKSDTAFDRDGSSSSGAVTGRLDLIQVIDNGEPGHLDRIAREVGTTVTAEAVNACDFDGSYLDDLPKPVDATEPGIIADGNVAVSER